MGVKGEQAVVQVMSERQKLNFCWLMILENLSTGEGGGTPCVAVKCVEIWKNTSGEGGRLDCN